MKKVRCTSQWRCTDNVRGRTMTDRQTIRKVLMRLRPFGVGASVLRDTFYELTGKDELANIAANAVDHNAIIEAFIDTVQSVDLRAITDPEDQRQARVNRLKRRLNQACVRWMGHAQDDAWLSRVVRAIDDDGWIETPNHRRRNERPR